MSFLKRWACQTAERQEQANRQPGGTAFFPVLKLDAGACGPGPPSPGNAERPTEERDTKGLELTGELNYLFNERASILEYEAGFAREQAERLAMAEIMGMEIYKEWARLQ